MPDIEEKTSDVNKEKSSDLATPGIINYLAILKIPVKLSSSNWAQWSMFAKKGLASVDKAHHLTKQPPDPISREWSIDDSGIQMALWNAMEPQILTIAQNFPTVKEMWDHLSSSFLAKESLSHAYSVVQAYSRAEQGESSFTNYFTRFSKLRDELRTMFPPTTDIKVQEERNNKMDVMMFIAGLSSKYSNARPLLLSNPTATSSVVSTYHLLREMYGPDTTTTDISAMHTSAGKAYVHDHRPQLTKLDPRAIRCVFLGYSQVQKGIDVIVLLFIATLLVPMSLSMSHALTSLNILIPFPTSFPPTFHICSTSYTLTRNNHTYYHLPTPDVPIYDPPGAPFPDIPISLCKEPRHYTRYPIQNYVAYSHLSSESKAYTSTLDSYPIPRDVRSALTHPGWRQAMEDELGALRARLVAKGYSQAYGIDYDETFSPVAKMPSVRICIALAAIHHWPLHQLDVKNAFLNGVLEEESPRAWFGRFSSVMGEFGMVRSASDYSVFFRHKQGKRIIVVVYVDDIIITGDDEVGITELKQFLQSQFQISDLGRLRYFLGIEVSRSPQGILLSQRKYVLDMLTECGLLGCKLVDTPMLPTRKLLPEDGDPMKDPERYRRLVGKLNCLTVTRPDTSFTVSVLSQFMAAPYTGHWDAALRVLRYLKTTPGLGILYSDQGHCRVGAFTEEGDGRISGFSDADWAGCPISRRSTTGYCVFVGGNLVSWKSKKQHTVSRSSAESEYRAMADVTSKIIWVRRLLMELGVVFNNLMRLYCDSQSAIHIAKNQVFHERTNTLRLTVILSEIE
ncbi:hypothetical protein OSB04_020560 [Centaurea solstitialis]|uniref:Reverse transcriptase Ty1/copia-type domain-containing protein n=1 Tax=Centaurea solstitialis TaxID=347529 RepID=A0AA38W403_9ASTR|nr:hypothetical protein OSB04_020560 [Centaurea solstitialis]